MKQLKMHSADLQQDNVSRIRELFPNCVTEGFDVQGNIKLIIDFDLLRQELSDTIVDGNKERYHLNWPGKREALITANAPIAKTLRPVRESSVDFENSNNLFVEGDNLDALKLLQETYLGKIKMIYIDPPYNTGNDFIYDDDFSQSTESYLLKSSQKNGNGERLIANTDSNGRFHSDWLNMMYPRLKLARNLLRNDGFIFISIDDNEISNLRRICDEIFGEDHFVGQLLWKRRVSSAMANNNVSTDHEYVICYQKETANGFLGLPKDFKKYSNPDNDPRGDWIADNLTVGMNASMRPNQAYDLEDPETGIKYPYNPNRVWAYVPDSMKKLIEEGRIIFPKDPNKRPMLKRFREELKNSYNPFPSIMTDLVGLNTEATRLMQDIMGGAVFEYSKPLSLIKLLLSQVTSSEDLILDFFAGAGTTAHAVMQLNAEDGGNRKFIMVQLAESCEEKSEAFKAGYQNIAELSKERIRRAGKKILEGDSHKSWNKDVGFRVLKIDSSNMNEVYYKPAEISQDSLNLQVDNIKSDRSSEDLLFQSMLDCGVDLSSPIKEETIANKKVFFVGEEEFLLIACFEKGVGEDLVKQLTAFQPERIIFRDNGFASDSVKINVEQIFKQMSSSTEVRSI